MSFESDDGGLPPIVPGDDYPLVFTFSRNGAPIVGGIAGWQVEVMGKDDLSRPDADKLFDQAVTASGSDASSSIVRVPIPSTDTLKTLGYGEMWLQARITFGDGSRRSCVLQRVDVLEPVIGGGGGVIAGAAQNDIPLTIALDTVQVSVELGSVDSATVFHLQVISASGPGTYRLDFTPQQMLAVFFDIAIQDPQDEFYSIAGSALTIASDPNLPVFSKILALYVVSATGALPHLQTIPYTGPGDYTLDFAPHKVVAVFFDIAIQDPQDEFYSVDGTTLTIPDDPDLPAFTKVLVLYV